MELTNYLSKNTLTIISVGIEAISNMKEQTTPKTTAKRQSGMIWRRLSFLYWSSLSLSLQTPSNKCAERPLKLLCYILIIAITLRREFAKYLSRASDIDVLEYTLVDKVSIGPGLTDPGKRFQGRTSNVGALFWRTDEGRMTCFIRPGCATP